jgi:hypothetical protein
MVHSSSFQSFVERSVSGSPFCFRFAMIHWWITMRNSSYGSLWIERWLPILLAAILAVTPVYADDQASAAPQNPPPATQPAPTPQPTPPAQQQPPPVQPMAPLPMVKNLKVLVLAGNGEMNDLERRVMAPLVVQVLDQNDRPVDGAEVVFRFPLNGPGATFAGGKTSQTVRTNGTGEAAAANWMANGEVGTFEVHVNAAYGNEMGETTLKMQNVSRIVETQGINKHAKQSHWYSPTWVKVALVAVAAGAVVGIVLATRGGSHSSTTNNVPITVTPGSPTVGQP